MGATQNGNQSNQPLTIKYAQVFNKVVVFAVDVIPWYRAHTSREKKGGIAAQLPTHCREPIDRFPGQNKAGPMHRWTVLTPLAFSDIIVYESTRYIQRKCASINRAGTVSKQKIMWSVRSSRESDMTRK
ncbi:hypothetical protein VTN00DRAFT_3690 [Thermoascus crustaceus]|uniref:uncharacterized protein n=1 Tax=Thermoascus crustaceus TaxID=5088 RepID=UPI0037449E43